MTDVKKALPDELTAFIDEKLAGEYGRAQLIAVLHKAQELFGYLAPEVLDGIAERMKIPTAHIWGVATFYHFFKLKPQGKHAVSVCLGTACFVKGAAGVLETIKTELGVEMGDTSDDGLFTLQETRCLGACGLAPVMMIDDTIYGELTPEKTIAVINDYRKKAAENAA